MLLRGVGVRWTPLRHSAEAPTEPAGETAVELASEGIKDNIVFTKKVEYGTISTSISSEELF